MLLFMIPANSPTSAPTGSPENVTAEAIAFDTVKVAWGEVSCLERGGEITGYEVRASIHGGVVGSSSVDVSTSVGVTHTATLTGLSPYQTYAISIAAVNDQGTGPHDTMVIVKTPLTSMQHYLQIIFLVRSH